MPVCVNMPAAARAAAAALALGTASVASAGPADAAIGVPSACAGDVERIETYLELYHGLGISDALVPARRYFLPDVDLPNTRFEMGLCRVACSGFRDNWQPTYGTVWGECRWKPDDWGHSIRFFGGCVQDLHDIQARLRDDGSVSARDSRDPQALWFRVITVQEPAVPTGEGCALACTSTLAGDGLCTWQPLDWGNTLGFAPSQAGSCMTDYQQMLDQIDAYSAMLVPDAQRPDTAAHWVDGLRGAPTLDERGCASRCTSPGKEPGSCSWQPGNWGDTIRYRAAPAA